MALAIVTCMDNRLPTGQSMGLDQGEAFVLRNAGGRATTDVLRSLTVACSVLSVCRVAVVHHTDCRALAIDDARMRRRLISQLGVDPGPMKFLGRSDLRGSVLSDLAMITSCPTIPRSVEVEGFVFDVETKHLLSVSGEVETHHDDGGRHGAEHVISSDEEAEERPGPSGFPIPD